MKLFLSIASVLLALLGAGWLFSPETGFSGWGVHTDAVGMFVARRYGVMLIGYAVILWLGRASGPSAARTAILGGGGFVAGLVAVVSFAGILTGTIGPGGWITVAVEAVLAVGFGYYLLVGRSQAQTTTVAMPAILEENKALVRRFGEAIDARRYDLLDAVVSANFVRHCQATPQVEVNSLETFKEFLRQEAAAFPDSTQAVRHLVAEGDRVAIWATYSGTQQGAVGPFPPSGRKMQVEFGAVLRIENGRIAEMWVTWDNLAMMAQLGFVAQPAGT